jgi:hypothetical protein
MYDGLSLANQKSTQISCQANSFGIEYNTHYAMKTPQPEVEILRKNRVFVSWL